VAGRSSRLLGVASRMACARRAASKLAANGLRQLTLACAGAPQCDVQKGLRKRNSPMCTLSQNGYGVCF